MAYLQCIAGLALLIVGAQWFVRGASKLARSLGMTPLTVGLTVVALGTSAPEFAVVLQAALTGETGIAVGNAVGSNIFNTFLILGVSALAAPLVATQGIIRKDLLWMFIASAAILTLGLAQGRLGRVEGALCCLALATYVAWKVRSGRRETPGKTPAEPAPRPPFRVRDALFLTAGFAALIPASDWLVHGAAAIAASLGVSDLVIGLTVVAAGTSLPEAATSVAAIFQKERAIAVGNVVGSNLFNLLGVLGLAGALSAEGIPLAEEVVRFDLPVMALASLACLPFFWTNGKLSRWEGGALVAYYAAYAAYLVLAAGAAPESGLSSMKNLGNALYFMTPLALIVGGNLAFHAFSARKRKKAPSPKKAPPETGRGQA